MLPRHLFQAATFAVAASLAGCQSADGVAEVTVDQLSSMLAAASPPAVFDVNGEKVREEYGVIPGAQLLGDAEDYDQGLLPADKAKNLIFYCSNTWCSASKTAAKRAKAAGYTSVSVLPAGIKGWKESGKPTEQPAS